MPHFPDDVAKQPEADIRHMTLQDDEDFNKHDKKQQIWGLLYYR